MLLVAATVCSSNEAAAQQQPQIRYLTTNFSLKDASVAKLNRRLSLLGIGLPFSVEGKVTTQLQIGIPLRKLRDSRLYRIDGTITSPKLIVAGVELTDLSADIVYRDGVLSLQPLLVSVPEGAQANGQPGAETRPGQFRGTAEMKLVPRGDLSLALQFGEIPVRPLTAAVADVLPVDKGRLTGTMKASAPVNRLTEPAAWNGDGRLTVSSLSLLGQTWKQLVFRFSTEDETLRLTELSGSSEVFDLSGSARLNLTTPYGWNAGVLIQSNDLGGLLAAGSELEIGGELRTVAQATGSLAPQTYRSTGTLTLTDVTAGGLDVPAATAAFSLDETAARLTDLDVRLLSGRITGTAMVPLQEDSPQEANATATLWTVEPLQLEPLAAAIAGKPVPVNGRLNLSAEASVPRPRLTEAQAWQFRGEAAITEGTAWALAIDGEPIQAALQNGTLSLSKTQLSWGRTGIALAGEVAIEEPHPWSASLDIDAARLDDLTRIVQDVRPPIAVAGSAEFSGSSKGTLQPFDIAATGDVSSDGLTVAGARVDAFDARAAVDRRKVRLSEMKLELYGGQLTGEGTYPLAPGEGQFNFSWADIDLGVLAAEVADLPLQIHGRFSGKAEASRKAAADIPSGWTAESTFAVPEIRVADVPAGNIQGTVVLRDELLQFDVGGKLFDGDLDLNGELPLEELTAEEPPPTPPAAAPRIPPEPAEPAAGDGAALRSRLRMEGISLSLSLRALGYPAVADALGGTLDLEIDYQAAPSAGPPSGTGRVALRTVQWSGRTVTEEVSGEIRLTSDRLVIDSLPGELAGGRLRLGLLWDLAEPANRQFSVELSNAEIGRLPVSAPVPELPADLSGRIDVRAVLQRGDRWQAEGAVRLHRVRFGQAELNSLKLAGRTVFDGPLSAGSFSIPTITGSAAAGRLSGRLSGRWGARLNLVGRLRFTRIDLQSLGLTAVGVGQIGDGRLSGTVDITARKARSLSEAVVLLNASIGRTRPGRLPLFTELRPFLPAPVVDGTLDEGLLQARFTNGILRIEHLSLTGPSLRIFVTGTVARPDRLNLAMTVASGDAAANRPCIQWSFARLAASANPSVGILLRAQRVLSNRLIHLEVTGTVRRPVIRVLPLPLLSDEALRYFLEQAAA